MEEFYSIVPRQPYRPEDTPSEVRLEFEAVLLDGATNNPTKNQLWIHARIKACVNGADCVPSKGVSSVTNQPVHTYIPSTTYLYLPTPT